MTVNNETAVIATTPSAGRSGLSRRTLIGAMTGLMLAPGGKLICGPARAQTAAHIFKVGAFEVSVVSDGTLMMPPSLAMPGRDPEEIAAMLGSGQLPTDSITAQVNVTIVKTPEALILIDTGGGTDFVPTVGKLTDHLEAGGFTPDAFTHVIFTHAHADHLWGVIDPLDGGTRFTKARHIMTGVEFDYWSKPGRELEVPDMFKLMAVGTGRRLKALAGRFEFRKPGDEIVPGVGLVDTAGHTPGHVSIMLSAGGEQVLVGGDALNHAVASFVNPGWHWGSDMNPEGGVATRKRLLDQLAADKAQLLGYHLPWPGLGRVERKDSAYRFVQV